VSFSYLNTDTIDKQYTTDSFCHEKYVIKNFRINNIDLFNKIDSIDLEIGGSQIERIYPEIFPNLRSLYGIDDKYIIPFSFMNTGINLLVYHGIRITIVFKKDYGLRYSDLSLSVDLGELEHSAYLKHSIGASGWQTNQNQQTWMQNAFFQTQKEIHDSSYITKYKTVEDKIKMKPYIELMKGTDYSSLDPSTFTELRAIQRKFNSPSNHDAAHRLNFNRNVFYLICNRQIKDIELLIQHTDHTETIIQLTQTNGLIKLTPSNNVKDILKNKEYLNYGINLSRVNCTCLRFNYVNKKDKDKKDMIYAVSQQTVRIMSGLAGLAFET